MKVNKAMTNIFEYLVMKKKYNFLEPGPNFYYPIDLRFTLDNEEVYYFPKDNNGIPLKKYSSIGNQYNPTRIASYGFAHWYEFKKRGNKTNQKEFVKSLEWFYDNHRDGKWHYSFEWEDLKKDWISCMAQGEGISILLRGYILTDDEKFLEVAYLALDPFTKCISQGGVKSCIGSNQLFFEEYPSDEPVHVLNGFLYSLIGLIELKKIIDLNTHKKKYDLEILNQLISDCIEMLEVNIARWDIGYWSCYDLEFEKKKNRNLSSMVYHNLHISQLEYISKECNSEILKNTALNWRKYQENTFYRIRALISKSTFRLKNPVQR